MTFNVCSVFHSNSFYASTGNELLSYFYHLQKKKKSIPKCPSAMNQLQRLRLWVVQNRHPEIRCWMRGLCLLLSMHFFSGLFFASSDPWGRALPFINWYLSYQANMYLRQEKKNKRKETEELESWRLLCSGLHMVGSSLLALLRTYQEREGTQSPDLKLNILSLQLSERIPCK